MCVWEREVDKVRCIMQTMNKIMGGILIDWVKLNIFGGVKSIEVNYILEIKLPYLEKYFFLKSVRDFTDWGRK